MPACPRGALPHHTFISCVFPGLPHLAAPTPLAPRLLLPGCPRRPCSLFIWFLSSLFCSVGRRPAGPSADGILGFCPSRALCRITHHLCFPWAPVSPARCPHCCPRWSPSPGWQCPPLHPSLPFHRRDHISLRPPRRAHAISPAAAFPRAERAQCCGTGPVSPPPTRSHQLVSLHYVEDIFKHSEHFLP